MPRPVPATELEDPRAPAQGLSSRSVISDGNAHDQNYEKLCLFFIMVQFYTHRHIRTAFPISMIYDSWTGMSLYHIGLVLRGSPGLQRFRTS